MNNPESDQATSDNDQIDQLDGSNDAVPIIPKDSPAIATRPLAAQTPSTSDLHRSASHTSGVQPLFDEKQCLKAAFDELSAVVNSTADKTGLSTDSIVLKWIAQRPGSHAPKLKTDDVCKETTDATDTETPGVRISSTNPIEKELRDLVCEKADEIGLPVTAANGLQWNTLLDIMAENGCYFDNYPDVTLPGSTTSTGRKKGIRELTAEEQRILFDAMKATDHQCTFKPYKSQSNADIEALRNSEAPIIVYAPPTSASKLKRGKRYFLDGTLDFEGHLKCLQHPGCEGNEGEASTQEHRSNPSNRKRQSKPTDDTSNQREDKKTTRYSHKLRSRGSKRSAPSARRGSPLKKGAGRIRGASGVKTAHKGTSKKGGSIVDDSEDEDTEQEISKNEQGEQRELRSRDGHEGMDTRQEHGGTAVGAKRRRKTNTGSANHNIAPRPSSHGSVTPMREQSGDVPEGLSMQTSNVLPVHVHQQSAMNQDPTTATSQLIHTPPQSGTNPSAPGPVPNPFFVGGPLVPESAHAHRPWPIYPHHHGLHPDEQLLHERHRFLNTRPTPPGPSYYSGLPLHHMDHPLHYYPSHRQEHQSYYVEYPSRPSHYPAAYPSRFVQYPSGPNPSSPMADVTRNQSHPAEQSGER